MTVPAPGLHAAAERRRHAQVDVAADHDHVVLVRERMRGEARLPEEGPVHGAAVRLHGRRPVGADAARIERGEPRAVERPAGGALGTRATAPVAHDDGVARPDPLHAFADPLDDAGALVPEHDREAARDPRPQLAHAQVGVADPAGRQPDEDLIRARLVELDLLKCGRLAGGVRDRGEHSARRVVAAPHVLEQRGRGPVQRGAISSPPSPYWSCSTSQACPERMQARTASARRTSSSGRLPDDLGDRRRDRGAAGRLRARSSASARKTFVCSSKMRPSGASRRPGRAPCAGRPSALLRELGEPRGRDLQQLGAGREVAVHGSQRHAGRLRDLRVGDGVRMVVRSSSWNARMIRSRVRSACWSRRVFRRWSLFGIPSLIAVSVCTVLTS